MSGDLIVGLMSGTSTDGIDAALVKFTSAQELQLIGTLFVGFDEELKAKIAKLAHFNGEFNRLELEQLDHHLAELYAQASLSLIENSGFAKEQVTAIANHGQTIRHRPDTQPPLSIQLGSVQSIADKTGIQTIGQFRQGDLAVEGQGAPLMPAFHQAIFNQTNAIDQPTMTQHSRYLLNIGGIANITRLPAVSSGEPVLGFDTGPGNTLLDQWISQHQSVSYDDAGKWSAGGEVIAELLEDLLADLYFKATPPKSTGTDYFNLDWLKKQAPKLDCYSAQDVQATLLQLTVKSICQQINQLEQTNLKLNRSEGGVFVCGGGARNITLMNKLQKALPTMDVRSTSDLGIPADWVEAIGFAWLGYCHLHGINSNLPSVTGASKAVVLGELAKPRTTSRNHK